MSTNTHHAAAAPPGRLVEVADRVYAYVQPDGSWFVNNTGFVVGRSTVIGIDACATERRTRAYRERIAAVTPLPLSTLINTHHHGDHTYGNALMGAATIVGHDNCRAELLATGLPGDLGIWEPVDWGELELAPPTITFADRLRLWSDERPIDVQWVGRPAHTSSDSLVWLPDEQVLFCGDLLFHGGTPFLLMGSVTGAVQVLTEVVAPLPARTVVPGHGAPGDRSLIDPVLGYLRFLIDTARAGLAAGLEPLALARETELGEYADWLDTERLVGNLHRAYRDLDPSRPEVDVVQALREMVLFNDGRPLSCSA